MVDKSMLTEKEKTVLRKLHDTRRFALQNLDQAIYEFEGPYIRKDILVLELERAVELMEAVLGEAEAMDEVRFVRPCGEKVK